MDVNQRENYFAMLNGEKTDYLPVYGEIYAPCGNAVDDIVAHPRHGGYDDFGIKWMCNPSGAIPDSRKYVFDEMEDWEQYVTFPELDKIDMKTLADADLKNADRDRKVIRVNMFVGMFERLVAFMGFENALCALAIEPEACDAFFSAFTDYELNYIDRINELYHPDEITYYDDVATARGLFMSPACFRALIMPHTRQIIKSITSRGIICSYHNCGKCGDIIEDFFDAGVRIWHCAAPENDLEAIQKKYGHQVMIQGGWDSLGIPGTTAATKEDVFKEAKRCLETYGNTGCYALMPVIMNERGNAVFVGDARLDALIPYWHEIAYRPQA